MLIFPKSISGLKIFFDMKKGKEELYAEEIMMAI